MVPRPITVAGQSDAHGAYRTTTLGPPSFSPGSAPSRVPEFDARLEQPNDAVEPFTAYDNSTQHNHRSDESNRDEHRERDSDELPRQIVREGRERGCLILQHEDSYEVVVVGSRRGRITHLHHATWCCVAERSTWGKKCAKA